MYIVASESRFVKEKELRLLPKLEDVIEGVHIQLNPIGYQDKVWHLLKQVEDLIGLTDLKAQVLHSDEYEEGEEYTVIRGDNLRDLKGLLRVVIESHYPSLKYASQLILLSRSGVNLTLNKTDKAIGQIVRRWFNRIVWPSIQDTGQYVVPDHLLKGKGKMDELENKAQGAAKFIDGFLRYCFSLKIPESIAMGIAHQVALEHYSVKGFDKLTSHLLEKDQNKPALPVSREKPLALPAPDNGTLLEVSLIGATFLGVSGIAVNKFLRAIGWQIPLKRNRWQPTDVGRPYCVIHPLQIQGISTHNLAWQSTAVVQAWKDNPEIAKDCLPKKMKRELPPISEILG